MVYILTLLEFELSLPTNYQIGVLSIVANQFLKRSMSLVALSGLAVANIERLRRSLHGVAANFVL
jgi:hypothetical protein